MVSEDGVENRKRGFIRIVWERESCGLDSSGDVIGPWQPKVRLRRVVLV